jgi:hypothetical protein
VHYHTVFDSLYPLQQANRLDERYQAEGTFLHSQRRTHLKGVSRLWSIDSIVSKTNSLMTYPEVQHSRSSVDTGEVEPSVQYLLSNVQFHPFHSEERLHLLEKVLLYGLSLGSTDRKVIGRVDETFWETRVFLKILTTFLIPAC